MQKQKSGWKNEIKKLDKLKCPKCKSKRIYRYGLKPTKNGEKQRYQCRRCGHVWVDNGDNGVNNE